MKQSDSSARRTDLAIQLVPVPTSSSPGVFGRLSIGREPLPTLFSVFVFFVTMSMTTLTSVNTHVVIAAEGSKHIVTISPGHCTLILLSSLVLAKCDQLNCPYRPAALSSIGFIIPATFTLICQAHTLAQPASTVNT